MEFAIADLDNDQYRLREERAMPTMVRAMFDNVINTRRNSYQ